MSMTIVLAAAMLLPRVAHAAFQVTPASYMGEIGEDVIMECVYSKQVSSANRGGATISIDWLHAPYVTGEDRENQQVVNFQQIYSDRRRREITNRFEVLDETNVRNSSTLFIKDVQFSDMGKYKCIVDRGVTFGGAESPVAEIKLEPRLSIKPAIATIMRDRENLTLFCNITWPGFDQNIWRPGGLYDPINPVEKDSIEWLVNLQDRVDPDDPARVQWAYERAQSATMQTGLEVNGQSLMINFREERLAYNQANIDRQTGRLREELRRTREEEWQARAKYAGFYWCRFNYHLDKEANRVYDHAVVKFPLRFTRDEMDRSLRTFIGEEVRVECLFEGGPYYEIKWFKSTRPGQFTLIGQGNSWVGDQWPRSQSRQVDKLLYYKFERDANKQPRVLVMQDVQYYDKAEYSCNVTGFDGNMISYTVILRVKDKYNAYFPLGVIVVQVFLILGMIMCAELCWVKKPGLPQHTEHFSVADVRGSRRSLAASERGGPPNRDDFGTGRDSHMYHTAGGVSNRFAPGTMASSHA